MSIDREVLISEVDDVVSYAYREGRRTAYQYCRDAMPERWHDALARDLMLSYCVFDMGSEDDEVGRQFVLRTTSGEECGLWLSFLGRYAAVVSGGKGRSVVLTSRGGAKAHSRSWEKLLAVLEKHDVVPLPEDILRLERHFEIDGYDLDSMTIFNLLFSWCIDL